MFICYKFKWSEQQVMLMEIDRFMEYHDYLVGDPKEPAKEKAEKINQRIRKMKKGE